MVLQPTDDIQKRYFMMVGIIASLILGAWAGTTKATLDLNLSYTSNVPGVWTVGKLKLKLPLSGPTIPGQPCESHCLRFSGYHYLLDYLWPYLLLPGLLFMGIDIEDCCLQGSGIARWLAYLLSDPATPGSIRSIPVVAVVNRRCCL